MRRKKIKIIMIPYYFFGSYRVIRLFFFISSQFEFLVALSIHKERKCTFAIERNTKVIQVYTWDFEGKKKKKKK